MRNLKRIVLSVVTGALVVLPMVGCDETVDGTDTINLPDVNPDTSLPDTIVTRTYSAVYILRPLGRHQLRQHRPGQDVARRGHRRGRAAQRHRPPRHLRCGAR
jgi:hypothetical protein